MRDSFVPVAALGAVLLVGCVAHDPNSQQPPPQTANSERAWSHPYLSCVRSRARALALQPGEPMAIALAARAQCAAEESALQANVPPSAYGEYVEGAIQVALSHISGLRQQTQRVPAL